MAKYTATFTVTKSFEAEVHFEAPNDEVAAEMASDMAMDDSDFVSDRVDEDSVNVDSVSLDRSCACQDDSARVDRHVQRWCDQWLKDRAEDEAA